MQKIYLVTGAGHRPGIGSGVVQDLIDQNNHVIVNSRNFDQDWRDILERCTNVTIITGDITTADCQNRIQDIIHSQGRLDGLIHNASTGPASYDHQGLITDECWAENFQINCTVIYVLANKFRPYLEQARGSLVNIASRAAVTPGTGNNIAYAVSKAATIRLTQELALHLGPNIRANSVSPGLVLSKRFRSIMGKDLDLALDRWYQQSGVDQPISIKEVSDLVQLCLNSSGMTGQNITIAGKSTL